jgi:hypothetical protein
LKQTSLWQNTNLTVVQAKAFGGDGGGGGGGRIRTIFIDITTK